MAADMVGAAAARPTGRPVRRRLQGRRHHARRLGGQRGRRGMSPPHTAPRAADAGRSATPAVRAAPWGRDVGQALTERAVPAARPYSHRPSAAGPWTRPPGPLPPRARPASQAPGRRGPCGRSGCLCPRTQRPQQMGAKQLTHSRGGAGGAGRGGEGAGAGEEEARGDVRSGASPRRDRRPYGPMAAVSFS